MSGEDFLNKLYKDLAQSFEVTNHAINKSYKSENIRNYMKRLEQINDIANKKRKKELLFFLYYEKYVTKKENISNYFSEEEKNDIIKAQKESLRKWLLYLTDEKTIYPMWAKYWVFQGIIRIGNYNEATDSFMKRDKKTLAPFIEVNPAAVAKCIEIISKYIDESEIDDSITNILIEKGNFQKMYTKIIKNYSKQQRYESGFDGKWVKYNFGNEQDATILYNSLQGHNCPWCTAGSLKVAKGQILGNKYYIGGDFYVYYTYDEKYNPVIPRVAIRMDGTDTIGEIRGVADQSQNVEEGFEDIIKSKLEEIPTLTDESRKEQLWIIEDLRMLTNLNQKVKQKKELSYQEKEFIFECNRAIKTFGFDYDKRILEIRSYTSIDDINMAIKFITNNLNNRFPPFNEEIFKYIKPDIFNIITDDYELLKKAFKNNYKMILKYCSPKITFEILEKDDSLGIGDTNKRFRNDFSYVMKFANLLFEETGSCHILRYCSENLKNNKAFIIALLKLDAFNINFVPDELVIDPEVIEAAINSNVPYKYTYLKYDEAKENLSKKNEPKR